MVPLRTVRRPRAALVPAVLALAAAAVLPAAASAASPRTVHVRGTAYEFNSVHTMLAGARIRVAEDPTRSATVRPDGTYDLTVRAHAQVTPYIQAPGYHTIDLQTFTTNGANLENVNFQTPSDAVTAGLSAILNVSHDAAGYPTKCAIVSTFSTKNVRGVDYQSFIGYGAHGVAGAAAHTSPSLPGPTYFNEHVIPDPLQALSSEDGGVVWTEVPAGRYTISATSPTTRFASFVATCKPGRIVNANPPWGLHELATTVPTGVSAHWAASRTRAPRLRSLTVAKPPAHATITVRCGGRRCFRTTTDDGSATFSLDVRHALGAAAGRLKAGKTLDVTVAAPAFNAKVVSWRIPRRGTPRAVVRCIPLGDSLPQKRC